MSCSCSQWEIIDFFYSLSEYERVVVWLRNLLSADIVARVAVEKSPDDLTFLLGEEWFACKRCGKKWRLVPPDPPFRGLFEPVEPNEPQ